MAAAQDAVSDALRQLDSVVHKTRSAAQLKTNLRRTVTILNNRPYEPLLAHALRYVLMASDLEHPRSMREQALEHIQHLKSAIASAKKHAVESGSLKLISGNAIATHGSHALVRDIIMAAKHSGKKVSVHITSADHGRDLARHLASRGVDATLYTDSAAKLVIRGADIVMLGCTVITPNTIVAPMGSELLAEIARIESIPVYVVALGLQFDPKAEENLKKLQGFTHKITQRDPATGITHHKAKYEFINPDIVTGIISDLGIYNHRRFVEEVCAHHPWLE